MICLSSSNSALVNRMRSLTPPFFIFPENPFDLQALGLCIMSLCKYLVKRPWREAVWSKPSSKLYVVLLDKLIVAHLSSIFPIVYSSGIGHRISHKSLNWALSPVESSPHHHSFCPKSGFSFMRLFARSFVCFDHTHSPHISVLSRRNV